MLKSDLKRSYYQYIHQLKIGHIKVGILKKILLSCIFIAVFFLSIVFSFLYFKRDNQKKKNVVLDHSDIEPHKSFKKVLCADKTFKAIKINKWVFPILPLSFYRKIIIDFGFYSKRLPFLGALTFKLIPYFNMYHKHNINSLIVFQEYSFYMSYFTYMLESKNAKVYNIMHGIPGKEASFFRFTKCFVWGEYYKQYYIKQYAEKNQFIISGSIYHENLIKQFTPTAQKTIDIIYLMQGCKVISKDELEDVLEVLAKLSEKYTIAIRQHPLHRVNLPVVFKEVNEDSLESILSKTKMVISHFSTTLLDAKLLGVKVVSYNKVNRDYLIAYLEQDESTNTKELLEDTIVRFIQQKRSTSIEKKYIDLDKNTFLLIKEEMDDTDKDFIQ